MASRRARERANARPWEMGEEPAMKTAKPPCTQCGHTHCGTDVYAVGRFERAGPVGYVARNVVGATIRSTRRAAEQDACMSRQQRMQIGLFEDQHAE